MPVKKKAKAKAKKKTVKKTAKRTTKRTAKKKTAKRSAKKGAAKKRTVKKTAKKKTAKKKTKSAAKKKRTKRAPNPAFMKPMKPDNDLAAVIGNKAMPRTEITKKLWAYIKKNNLQDAANRRMINADDKLRPVFGNKKQVSMFEMTKLVSKHIKEA